MGGERLITVKVRVNISLDNTLEHTITVITEVKVVLLI